MTTETVLPLDNYPNGDTAITEVNIPDEANDVICSVLRCTAIQSDIWPDTATFARVTTQLFYEATGWEEWLNGNVEGWGGISKNKHGQDIPSMRFSGPIPAGTGRKLRGNFFVSDGPCRTEVTFEFV